VHILDLLPLFPPEAEYDFSERKGKVYMSKSRHTEAQMIEALKQLEACEGRKMWLAKWRRIEGA